MTSQRFAAALLFALVPASVPGAAALDSDAAAASLAAGRFAEALELAHAESDPRKRAVSLADVHYRARDFDAVLALAAEAVAAVDAHGTSGAAAPEPVGSEVHVLWRATAAALWKQDGARATELVEHLDSALGYAAGAQPQDAAWMNAENTAFFAAQREAFAQSAGELVAAERGRAAAVTRAKRTVALGLGLWALAFAWLLRANARSATPC